MKLSRSAVVSIVTSYGFLISSHSRCCDAFGVVPPLPSPDIVFWTQQHVITTATSTVPKLPDLFALYQNALHTLPLQTQMMTGAVLAVAGDTVAQTVNNHNEAHRPFDLKRTFSFAAFDACYRAVQHVLYPPMKDYFHGQFLYPAISSILPPLNAFEQHHNQILSAAAEQSLISQLVVIPLLYYPIFFAVTGMVQGLTWEQSMERGKQSFVPLMQRNLLFWIPVQFGVFGWINDDALQISVLIACGFIWTMILSAFAGSAAVATTTKLSDPNASNTSNMIDEQQVELYMSPMVESDLDNNNLTPILPKPLPSREMMAYAAVGISSNSTGMDMMILTEDDPQQLLR
jgi:Mpv17 / PMP22 family